MNSLRCFALLALLSTFCRGDIIRHGNWCGPNIGGLANNCGGDGKSCPACADHPESPTPECIKACPPLDDVDSACMKHDFCLKNRAKPASMESCRWGTGAWANECGCDCDFLDLLWPIANSDSKNKLLAYGIFQAFSHATCWSNVTLNGKTKAFCLTGYGGYFNNFCANVRDPPQINTFGTNNGFDFWEKGYAGTSQLVQSKCYVQDFFWPSCDLSTLYWNTDSKTSASYTYTPTSCNHGGLHVFPDFITCDFEIPYGAVRWGYRLNYDYWHKDGTSYQSKCYLPSGTGFGPSAINMCKETPICGVPDIAPCVMPKSCQIQQIVGIDAYIYCDYDIASPPVPSPSRDVSGEL